MNFCVSIHALLAESDPEQYEKMLPLLVSIHALLAESDKSPPVFSPLPRCFNPRPPCGERRHEGVNRRQILGFQSTPSLRRATPAPGLPDCQEPGFNPRPPCGERPGNVLYTSHVVEFQSTPSLRRATHLIPSLIFKRQVSIHALLAESDAVSF